MWVLPIQIIVLLHVPRELLRGGRAARLPHVHHVRGHADVTQLPVAEVQVPAEHTAHVGSSDVEVLHDVERDSELAFPVLRVLLHALEVRGHQQDIGPGERNRKLEKLSAHRGREIDSVGRTGYFNGVLAD